jgi:hypothetical protein
MARAALALAALMMGVSPLALAQTAPGALVSPAKPVADAPSTPPPSGGMRQQMTAKLEAAGFTDVKIIPESFLVQAKDKAGDPVTVFLDQDSITVFTTADAISPDAATSATKPAVAGIFADIPANDDLSSKLVGLDIYNAAKEKLGTIKDVAFGSHGVKAYIVGVGGYLGVGDRYVAIKPSAVKIGYSTATKAWSASMAATAADLKAAPEYKYASNS